VTGSRARGGSPPGPPQLAVVVPTDSWERLSALVRSLELQVPPLELELVAVTEDPAAVDVPSEWQGRVTVTRGPGDDVPAAHAAGVVAASAPIVFLAETHAYPAPTALPALVAAFGDPSVACAVPRIGNANPRTSRSWVSLHVAYGRWVVVEPVEMATAPAFNAAWRREALLALGDRLADALGAGGGVDDELRASGARLLGVPEAVVEHTNVVRTWTWLANRIDSSRLFAAARSRSWSRPRRALYGVGSPALAPLLVWRTLRSPAWRSTASQRGAASVPLLAVSATAASLGEALGYLTGSGGARRRVTDVELRRSSYA
jgi:hypothetical protein